MFSQESRCIYRNPQVADVICQLRFPEILSIGTTVPDKFQEAIRSEFPKYAKLQEMPAPKLTGTPGNLTMQKPEPTINHQFASADQQVHFPGLRQIHLLGGFCQEAG